MLRKCGNCAQEKVNYVQKVYYAHYVVLIIDDSGQVKGETCTVQLKCTACLLYNNCWPVKCGYITPTWNMNGRLSFHPIPCGNAPMRHVTSCTVTYIIDISARCCGKVQTRFALVQHTYVANAFLRSSL